MKTSELKDYFEATRDDNEKSFKKWCIDHEWYQRDGLWYCKSEEEDYSE